MDVVRIFPGVINTQHKPSTLFHSRDDKNTRYKNLYLCCVRQKKSNQQLQGGGGGGYSDFFLIHRLGPSICSIPPKNTWSDRSPPKNIRNFKHTKKLLENLDKLEIKIVTFMYLAHHV